MASLVHSVWSQIRIVCLIAQRELLIQSRYRNKFFVDVFSHLLGILPIVLITIAMSGESLDDWAVAGESATRISFVILGFLAFLAFGFGTPVMLYSGMGWAMSTEVGAGTLERNFLAPVSRSTIVLGLGLYYVMIYLFHVLTLLAIAAWLLRHELVLTSGGIYMAAAVVVGILGMSVGMGLAAAGIYLLVRDHSLFQIIVHRPFMMLSGAIFVLELLPAPLRILAMANPVTYAVDVFRGSLSEFPMLVDPGVGLAIVYFSAFGLVVVGVVVLNMVVKRQMANGSLTHM